MGSDKVLDSGPKGRTREWSWGNLGLNHLEPRLFYTSQWTGYPIIYVMYRVVVALYFLVWIVLTGTENHRYATDVTSRLKWFIFLTNWTACVLTFSLLVQAVVAVYCYLTIIRPGKVPLCTMPWYLRFQWAWYNLEANSAFVITILYWALLYASKPRSIEEIMFHTHATNSIYVLIDLFVTAIPIRLLHFYYGIIYAITYVIFSAIHCYFGGSNYGNHPYIYRLLDWGETPMFTTLYSVGTAFVAMPLVWMVQYGLYRLRLAIANSCRSKKPESLDEKPEGIDVKPGVIDEELVYCVTHM